MNLKKQLLLALLLSLFSAICFGLLSFLISSHKIAQFDQVVSTYIQGFESPFLTTIMIFISFIGSAKAVVVLSIIVLIFLYKILKHRSEFVLFTAVVAGSSLLNVILKSLFHRERPSIHRLITENGFSFPSGHSMEAVAFYGVVTFLLWRHISSRTGRAILFTLSSAMILSIGISRIYLGVHYPSDVFGGYFASTCWLAAAIGVYQRFSRARQ